MKRLLLAFAMLFAFSAFAAAQTTAFNFQGRLNDGNNPANGRYDLQFKLFDAITGGNQVGATLDKPNLLLNNGVFSTQLDFGPSIFTGSDRFIEISLRPTVPANITPNAFVILGARQQIMSVPYSVKSLNATNSDNATNAINATTATTAVNSQQLGGLPDSRYLKTDSNGDLTINGKVTFNGNLYQPATAAGLPKALVRLDRDGVILNCFNGVTGQTANTCGFTAVHDQIGSYYIEFGFVVRNRIILATSVLDGDSTAVTLSDSSFNTRINYFVTYISNRIDGTIGARTNAPVNVLVY
jgi:hypothetical protein